jgi:CheY-like chemotaxis protein
MLPDGVRSSRLLHPLRILLCDDSPVERLALGHFLRQNGFDVDEVGDGQSAIESLRYRMIDLILLDLHMPGVDGFAVLKYLHQHRPGLPVLVLSGMPVDDIQQEIHGLPNHELPPLLLKPVDPEQLLDLIAMRFRGFEDSSNDSVEDSPAA